MLAQTLTNVLVIAASLAAALPTSLNPRQSGSGRGTVYLQEGGTGSCGTPNPDDAIIAAISDSWMLGESPGPYCGRYIQATNVGSDDGVGGAGSTFNVLVADTCPSCGPGDVDFSVGAWNALTNGAPYGTFDVVWQFI
ncbi:MAG: hypothetical protein MMC33_002237 [Icmadophila ericetorum]|nr:hypothetical protein [Icmadophila ericetorum]